MLDLCKANVRRPLTQVRKHLLGHSASQRQALQVRHEQQGVVHISSSWHRRLGSLASGAGANLEGQPADGGARQSCRQAAHPSDLQLLKICAEAGPQGMVRPGAGSQSSRWAGQSGRL